MMCSARLLLLRRFRVFNKKKIDYEKLRKKSSPFCGSDIRSRQHSLALFLSGGHSHGAVSECMR